MPEAKRHMGARDDFRGLTVGGRGYLATICPWDPEYDRESKSFGVGRPAPDGMCQPCAGENDDKVASVALRICRDEYAGNLVLVDNRRFKVPAAAVRRKKYTRNARESKGLHSGTQPRSTPG
jgi:hypothetical protein